MEIQTVDELVESFTPKWWEWNSPIGDNFLLFCEWREKVDKILGGWTKNQYSSTYDLIDDKFRDRLSKLDIPDSDRPDYRRPA